MQTATETPDLGDPFDFPKVVNGADLMRLYVAYYADADGLNVDPKETDAATLVEQLATSPNMRGVEGCNSGDFGYGTTLFTYANTGDNYAPTLIYREADDTLYWCGWADMFDAERDRADAYLLSLPYNIDELSETVKEAALTKLASLEHDFMLAYDDSDLAEYLSDCGLIVYDEEAGCYKLF